MAKMVNFILCVFYPNKRKSKKEGKNPHEHITSVSLSQPKSASDFSIIRNPDNGLIPSVLPCQNMGFFCFCIFFKNQFLGKTHTLQLVDVSFKNPFICRCPLSLRHSPPTPPCNLFTEEMKFGL